MAVTYDKAARVLFWGGVSSALASLLALLGLASWWPAFLASWTLAGATYLTLASFKVFSVGKAVLITGCDSGFGFATALFLDQMMDVTQQEQIDNALSSVRSLLPPGEVLWGLVNNAGVSQYGAVEWVSMDDYRSICEVNLFGTIAVTKAFLPLIRSAKGRVVNVGSVRGRMTSPLGAAYEVSKYGVEAFSDVLRRVSQMQGNGESFPLIC
ncbi:putative D-beta-hydroxybutyrate dehydrogenase, mitochondrial-like [Penaeus vannamei]|uniref:Putative D-beta-hydroxybutyrate dehydrogenase, mitochondrial-like n=1 Tax=Penaeus vannamei TaxID=6689 RepID=A0A3R7PE54_PENVA|nr:putative D-beta-hydroxybutyrate dehydrogenase, mitochondrial-like [Penaeus vannamei]